MKGAFFATRHTAIILCWIFRIDLSNFPLCFERSSSLVPPKIILFIRRDTPTERIIGGKACEENSRGKLDAFPRRDENVDFGASPAKHTAARRLNKFRANAPLYFAFKVNCMNSFNNDERLNIYGALCDFAVYIFNLICLIKWIFYVTAGCLVVILLRDA